MTRWLRYAWWMTGFQIAALSAQAGEGPRLLGADGTSGQLLEIDPASGATSLIGPFSHAAVASLAYDSSSGTLFATTAGASNGLLLRVNPSTGATTRVGALGIDCCMHGLAYNPDNDTLYGVRSGNPVRLYAIDRDTGEASIVAPLVLIGLADLAYDTTNHVMWLSDVIGQRLFEVDLDTGALTLVGPFNATTLPFPQVGVAMAYHPSFGLLASDNTGVPGNPNPLFQVNTSNGQTSLIGHMSSTNVLGLAFLADCVADLNGDGVVALEDLAILLFSYGESDASPEEGDLNGDGAVGVDDLAILLTAYGEACG